MLCVFANLSFSLQWSVISYLRPIPGVLSSFFDSNMESSSSVKCQTTGPKPLPKRFLHIVRSTASSFNSQYPLLSSRSSSNFLRLLPCLLVTSICPFIFPSITRFRRQFLRKVWRIQLTFRFIISCRNIYLYIYMIKYGFVSFISIVTSNSTALAFNYILRVEIIVQQVYIFSRKPMLENI